MEYMLSLDLGKCGGMAYWNFSANGIVNSCYDVYGWDLGVFRSTSEGLCDVIYRIENFLKEKRGDISVEKPGRHLPYQWVLYTDIKNLASKYKVDYHEYHPMTIKKIVAGNGKAGKEEIQNMIGKLLHLPDDDYTEHMYDAIATGICHLKTIGVM